MFVAGDSGWSLLLMMLTAAGAFTSCSSTREAVTTTCSSNAGARRARRLRLRLPLLLATLAGHGQAGRHSETRAGCEHDRKHPMRHGVSCALTELARLRGYSQGPTPRNETRPPEGYSIRRSPAGRSLLVLKSKPRWVI
jgi:hypothetical protein